MPAHGHSFMVSTATDNDFQPGPNTMFGTITLQNGLYQSLTAINAQMKTAADIACTYAGGNAPHSNMMPSLCVSFIIALLGNYPTQQ